MLAVKCAQNDFRQHENKRHASMMTSLKRSARITFEGVRPSMSAVGLRQRIKVRKLDALEVKYRSGEGVYLLKK